MSVVNIARPADWHVAPMYSLLLLACLAQGSPQGDQGFYGTIRPSPGSLARGLLAPSGVAERRSGGMGLTVSGVSAGKGTWERLGGAGPLHAGVEEGRRRMQLRGGAGGGEGSKEEFVQRARGLLFDAGGAMYSSTFEESWERTYPDDDIARSAAQLQPELLRSLALNKRRRKHGAVRCVRDAVGEVRTRQCSLSAGASLPNADSASLPDPCAANGRARVPQSPPFFSFRAGASSEERERKWKPLSPRRPLTAWLGGAGRYKSSESMSLGQLVQKTGAFDVESSPNKGQSTKLFRIPGAPPPPCSINPHDKTKSTNLKLEIYLDIPRKN